MEQAAILPLKFISILSIIILLSACDGRSIRQVPAVDTLIPAETPLTSQTPIPTNTFLPSAQNPIDPEALGPNLSNELPTDTLVLGAHIYADNTCFDVGVYRDGYYVVLSCILDFAYPAPTGLLDANESAYLQRWVNRFQSYDEPSAHGLIRFVGNGSVVPDYAEKLSMEYLVRNLEYRAQAYVSGGGMPTAVFATQQVLSQRLVAVLPDQITVLNFEMVDFPDACLGAPKPEEACVQVITQGLRVLLVAQGLLYEYHTDFAGYDIRQYGQPQIAPTPAAG